VSRCMSYSFKHLRAQACADSESPDGEDVCPSSVGCRDRGQELKTRMLMTCKYEDKPSHITAHSRHMSRNRASSWRVVELFGQNAGIVSGADFRSICQALRVPGPDQRSCSVFQSSVTTQRVPLVVRRKPVGGCGLLIVSPANPTPLVALYRIVPSGAFQLYLKVAWYNPFGSIKDRTAAHLLRGMAERGEFGGKGLVEPSSGNTGIALAALAALMGKKLVVTIPDGVPGEKKLLLRMLGAEMWATPDDLCPVSRSPATRPAKWESLEMAPHTWIDEEIWDILRECICDALGVESEDVTCDARMVEDLGMEQRAVSADQIQWPPLGYNRPLGFLANW